MKLDLNDNEVGAFVAVMDLALKGGGLAALGAVSAAMAILEAAKRADLEAAQLAEQLKAAEGNAPIPTEPDEAA